LSNACISSQVDLIRQSGQGKLHDHGSQPFGIPEKTISVDNSRKIDYFSIILTTSLTLKGTAGVQNRQVSVYCMRCKTCGSDRVGRFRGEIAIHFPGRKNVDKPTVFVFPELAVCLACGAAQFYVPDDQLCLLEKGAAESSGSL
jgi:hypothetical protein